MAVAHIYICILYLVAAFWSVLTVTGNSLGALGMYS